MTIRFATSLPSSILSQLISIVTNRSYCCTGTDGGARASLSSMLDISIKKTSSLFKCCSTGTEYISLALYVCQLTTFQELNSHT